MFRVLPAAATPDTFPVPVAAHQPIAYLIVAVVVLGFALRLVRRAVEPVETLVRAAAAAAGAAFAITLALALLVAAALTAR